MVDQLKELNQFNPIGTASMDRPKGSRRLGIMQHEYPPFRRRLGSRLVGRERQFPLTVSSNFQETIEQGLVGTVDSQTERMDFLKVSLSSRTIKELNGFKRAIEIAVAKSGFTENAWTIWYIDQVDHKSKAIKVTDEELEKIIGFKRIQKEQERKEKRRMASHKKAEEKRRERMSPPLPDL